MNFNKPIIVSFIIHSAFVSAIVIGASFFGASDSLGPGAGGSGGIVSVWIAGPDGAIGDLPPSKFIANLSRQKTPPVANPAQGGDDGQGGGQGGGSQGEGAGSGAGGGGVADPRLAKIWKKINSSKYYPQSAKRKGIEGAPRVTFVIEEDGSVKSVEITASSGEAILDDAAMETVRRGAPLPYYPEPITLAVKYSLKD